MLTELCCGGGLGTVGSKLREHKLNWTRGRETRFQIGESSSIRVIAEVVTLRSRMIRFSGRLYASMTKALVF